MSREASLAELRTTLQEAFAPSALVVRRGHEGVVDLRILSERFADAEDPLGLLHDTLEEHGLRLPDRTLTLLKSPDELEAGEERLLFSQQILSTPNWADALALEPQPPVPDERGLPEGVKLVAFWGLKGGVGRSTALAHVALLLGRRQVRVLAIDLDLESPALVASLADGPDAMGGPRFDDLMRLAGDPAVADAELLRQTQQALMTTRDSGALVEMLGPAQADGSFVRSLLGPLAPSVMYRGEVKPLLRLVRTAVQASGAQVVLLDARSGYCDESAVAVLDLADQVVLFASPAPSTYPSLAPAVEALERSRRAKGRPLLHIVAGMMPAGEQARQRVREDLQAELEGARTAVAERLATPPEALPPDIDIITIDYSARVVENDGGLLISGVSEGYRDLAERLLPPPLPNAVTRTEAGWVERVVREARVPVPEAESEEDPEVLARLFTRTPDLDRFVRHNTFLVKGAKGTGKSYLRRICLEHKELILRRSGVLALQNALFVDAYSAPRRGGTFPPVSPNLLRELDEELGERWNEVWSALALGRVLVAMHREGHAWRPPGGTGAVRKALERLVAADGEQEVKAALRSLLGARQSLFLSDAWRALDRWCEESDRAVILLFDDLDVALGETDKALERRRHMIVGLLDQANASWVASHGVSVKLFLRSDIFDRLGTEEQAKYEGRAITLTWRPDDIWRLIIRAVAVASQAFRTHVEARGVSVDALDETPREDWVVVLELIWGERLGAGESNTRSTSWAQGRLRDGNDQLFPRAALWLIEQAVERRRSKRLEEPPLLDPASLRGAMPVVSSRRLQELLTERGHAERERIMRLKGFKSYQNESDFLMALKGAGERHPEDALETLKRLGMVETGSRRDKTPTVRIVDLYAFAPQLAVERLGRR